MRRRLNSDVCIKYDDVVHKIVQTYDVTGSFDIVGTKVCLTKEDIVLVFGIQCGTKPLPETTVKRKDVAFVAR